MIIIVLSIIIIISIMSVRDHESSRSRTAWPTPVARLPTGRLRVRQQASHTQEEAVSLHRVGLHDRAGLANNMTGRTQYQ